MRRLLISLFCFTSLSPFHLAAQANTAEGPVWTAEVPGRSVLSDIQASGTVTLLLTPTNGKALPLAVAQLDKNGKQTFREIIKGDSLEINALHTGPAQDVLLAGGRIKQWDTAKAWYYTSRVSGQCGMDGYALYLNPAGKKAGELILPDCRLLTAHMDAEKIYVLGEMFYPITAGPVKLTPASYDGYPSAFILCLDKKMQPLWGQVLEVEGNLPPRRAYLMTDALGNVTAGISTTILRGADHHDAFVARWDSKGKLAWSRHFRGGQGSLNDNSIREMLQDKEGNTYVLASFSHQAFLYKDGKVKPEKGAKPNKLTQGVGVVALNAKGAIKWQHTLAYGAEAHSMYLQEPYLYLPYTQNDFATEPDPNGDYAWGTQSSTLRLNTKNADSAKVKWVDGLYTNDLSYRYALNIPEEYHNWNYGDPDESPTPLITVVSRFAVKR